jgi:LuxR family maltose regulon positive regulatory protein
VPRTRLIHRLSSGLEGRRLTLLSAAAGFGKTTLLCEWLDSLATARSAWLALDEGDNDPARFWRYLLTALATLSPGLDTQLLPLLPTTQSDRYFLTMLVNTLNSTLDHMTSPALLFLDDYHVITTPTLHQALDFLVEHLEHLHIVISTRTDPPLRLALLRGRRQLLELRNADLRFTTEESTIFLRESIHLTLTPEEQTLLYAQTEGWVTGLHLAALTLQDHTHIPHVLQTLRGSQRYILEYLTDEVLQKQPESIRTFLLHTSILARLSAPLCDALCPQTNSQETLILLEQKNLFLIPLDAERHWFRYHHLFTDVLSIRLRQLPDELRNELHLRACDWYAHHGYEREAIYHALAARHWSRVMSLLEPIARALIWIYGEVITVLRWIEQIPLDLVRTRPRLCLIYAWLLILSGSQTDIETWLDAAASAPPETLPFIEVDPYQHMSRATSTVHSQISVLQTLLSGMRGNIEQTLVLCQQAYTHLMPEDHIHLAVVQNAEGLALQAQGQVEAACTRFLAASQNMLMQGVGSSANIFLDDAAQSLVIQGKLHEAWQVAQQATHLGSTPDGPALPNACYAYATLASILYEWNDLDGALEAITQGITQGEQTGNTDFLCSGYPVLMQVNIARGSLLEARRALTRAEEVARKRDIAVKYAQIATARVFLWLAEGRLEDVAHWQQSRQQQKQPPPPLHAEMQALLDARYALLTQRPQEALTILDSLLPAAEAGKRGDRILKILLLQTLAYQALERDEQAGACLERLLPLAEREGYLRIFLDMGMPPDKLFTYLPEHLKTSMTVRAVLRAWRQPSLTTTLPTHEDRPVPPLVEPLSPREMEILHQIASGATNQEIAETLVIAPNTVKRHISNILGKLGVNNRTQALVQARKMGLL